MMKTWNDVSVSQWQQLIELSRQADLDEHERGIETLSVLTGMTSNQISALDAITLAKKAAEISFVAEHPLNPDPVKIIAVNGRYYRVNDDAEKMPAGRYIETKYFAGDIEMNLHRIAAAMVIPVKRGKWFKGFPLVDGVFNPLDFEMYSADMADAKINDVLGSVVFFCAKLKTLILNSPDYWVEKLMMMMTPTNPDPGMNYRLIAKMAFQILCNNLDGFTTQRSSRNMNG